MFNFFKKPRLRFSPSPTGRLHLGGLRTALFDYLAAKSLGGKLILRIEDTDQKREVAGAAKGLVDVLKWAGIDFDEGPETGGKYGPYIQSERLPLYKKRAEEILALGGAYRCFCSPERLEKMRAEQAANKLPPRYDRACRDLSAEEIQSRLEKSERFVIRQKMPLSGEVAVRDELRGEIKFKAYDLEDHVLVKSDGLPTYQLASVVDDHEMKITHVLRGEEWISSFPKNILLYQAFGWSWPKFYHLPLIMDKAGGKLSKRKGDAAVEDYRDQGYLPSALLNFTALLGWHPRGDNEILDKRALEKEFKLENIGTSPAIFDREKLDYFNGYYIRQMNIKNLTALCLPFLKNNLAKADAAKQKPEFVEKAVLASQERLKKIEEIAELTEFLFADEINIPAGLLAWKKMDEQTARANLKSLSAFLEKIGEGEWEEKNLEEATIKYLKDNNFKIGEYLWPLRVALSGRPASPGPFTIAAILGKEESLDRARKLVESQKEKV